MAAPDWLSLDDGESVEWTGEPALASKMDAVILGGALVSAFGLGLLILVPAYLSVRNTAYALTDEAVYVKSGILSNSVERTDLSAIRSTDYDESFWERGAEYGTVEIYTSPTPVADVELAAIVGAHDVQDQIDDLVHAAGDDGAASAGGQAPVDGQAATAGLREAREELARALAALETVEAAVAGASAPGESTAAAEELARYREAIESVRATVDRAVVARSDDGGGEGAVGGTDERAALGDLGAVADDLASTREELETVEATLAGEPSTRERDAP